MNKTRSALCIAALYLRLSVKEDGEEESSSIQTQRLMLRQYAKEHGIVVYDEYVDDGYSGTSFDRPDFKRMIRDVESGKINAVITKDLSRLGRDYILAGQYVENYFPEHGIRYIAINDGVDTLSEYNDIAPFKNILNEMYAKDTSRKIRSAFHTKMKNGDYISSFEIYGYSKDPANKNHLVIDPVSASVVREIFQMAYNGVRPGEIASRLNERNVPTPAQYRCIKHPGLDVNRYSKRQEWTSSGICKILRSEVYLGNLLQGKTKKLSFKSNVVKMQPRDEWCITLQTHEPIISQEVFDVVQKRRVSRRQPPTKGFKNIFSGVAFCADCGTGMSSVGTRKKGEICNLECGRYKLYGTSDCSNHFIGYTELYNIVLSDIQSFLSMSDKDRLDVIQSAELKLKREIDDMSQGIDPGRIESRLLDIERLTCSLYEDRLNGTIGMDTFSKMIARYEEERERLSQELERIKEMQQKSVVSRIPDMIVEELKAMQSIEVLTPDLLKRFVKRINVHQRTFDRHTKKAHYTIDIEYTFMAKSLEVTMP